MTPTLVIALHGTRHKGGREFAAALVAAVQQRLPGVEVVPGWVDVEDVLLAETLAGLDRAVVVPTFLAAGYHVEHDVPAAVAATGGRAVATEHVGGDLVEAMAERLVAAGPIGDAVLLAAIGSKRPGAQAAVHRTADVLAARFGVPVRPGFIYASEPTLAQTLDRLRAEGHRRVSVATHALAPGLYQNHIEALGLEVVAAPIGVHPRLVDAIVGRYVEGTLR